MALLHDAIQMSIRDFDEEKIMSYRLTSPEMQIIYEMANVYDLQGQHEKAIELSTNLLEILDDARASEEDKGLFVPILYLNLGLFYEQVGDYQKGLKFAHQSWDACKEYRSYRFIHLSLYRIAFCQLSPGEDELFYKPFLVRSYHFASALSDHTFAKQIKESAEQDFDITFDF
jgi:tetratricopeptide (TPR) repeat protein